MDKNLTIHISFKEYEYLKNKVSDLQSKLDVVELKLFKTETSLEIMTNLFVGEDND